MAALSNPTLNTGKLEIDQTRSLQSVTANVWSRRKQPIAVGKADSRESAPISDIQLDLLISQKLTYPDTGSDVGNPFLCKSEGVSLEAIGGHFPLASIDRN